MEGRHGSQGIGRSNIFGSASLILAILTFALFFMFPRSGAGLATSLLSITTGMVGLTTQARARAGFGIFLGIVGGALCFLPFLVVPM